MRFDLTKSCRNCPFADTPERITFACRERAEEIAETAYRQGFVCHLSADLAESEDGESDGYEFRDDGKSQHCFGALAMHLKQGGGGNVPWEHAIDEDPELEEKWWERVGDWELASIFDGEDAFLDANT